MGCKTRHTVLWLMGCSLGTVSCLAFDANKPLTPAPVTPGVHEVVNAWPWLAVGAILLLLAVIAWAARRRSPFGRRS